MSRLLTFAAITALLTFVPSAEAAGGTNPFEGTIYQSIAALIIFLGLLAILGKYAWGPILQGLQDRENKIRDDLVAAEKAAADAHATLEAYRRELAQAQEKARLIIEQSRKDAERVAADIKASAQIDIAQAKERAERDIQSARDQALAEIYEQTAELATDVARRILQREVNTDDQKRLVDASLAKLREASNN